MNNELKQELILAKQNNELVAIYNFKSDDTFTVGYIVVIDSLFVLVLGLDTDSKINGLNAVRLSSIHNVKRDNDYLINVRIREENARQYGYYDIWNLEEYLGKTKYGLKPILIQLLTEAFETKEPVVIGTKEFKDQDDFDGLLTELTPIKLTLHYLNFEDLSSLWERPILLADIDYIRVKGMQAHNSQSILRKVFNEPNSQAN